MEAWKLELGKRALELGIIKDPQCLDRMDDPMPLWAVVELVLQLADKLDPPSISYD
ncbi:hypothetical protein [Paenibacillus eucommiae]|uniref:Uncharacterized protein n=1 Tax=Paenibacillus eucommiae TaxID=1355755 RepID=A0ABS4J4Q0_9BACL|nr:hypothetical protein [Paenibacillus eucommiae]MBP1994809.1 hypothetical protein [Paenibacillus eucommiae]